MGKPNVASFMSGTAVRPTITRVFSTIRQTVSTPGFDLRPSRISNINRQIRHALDHHGDVLRLLKKQTWKGHGRTRKSVNWLGKERVESDRVKPRLARYFKIQY